MRQKHAHKIIIGIDEVGRGALAGPVVVAAAATTKPLGRNHRVLGTLRDSKQLSPQRREAWFDHFRGEPEISYAIARVYPRKIESMNISAAANLAASRALDKLFGDLGISANDCCIYLDGGLYAGNGAQPKSAKTIIKGDEKIPAIAVASIIAKVSRDRQMVRLAKRHPAYGFEIHKGYGTKTHRAAIKKHGPSPAHRLTFIGGTHTIKE